MKTFRSLIFREDRVCPWWLAWTFDNPLRRLIHKPKEIFGPYVREGMIVADLGCGMGYFSIAMAKMVGKKGVVISLDLQQEMLDLTVRRARKAGVADRIRPVRARESDIMISDPVDFVLAFWMVHEVQDIPQFFRQVASILNEGGAFLYAEPRMHVSSRRFKEILGYAQEAGFRVSDVPTVRFSRAALMTAKKG